MIRVTFAGHRNVFNSYAVREQVDAAIASPTRPLDKGRVRGPGAEKRGRICPAPPAEGF